MVTVVKAGGEILADSAARDRAAEQIAAATGPTVLVHGGGPQLDAACAEAGVSFEKVDGRRITSPAVLALAVRTWRGEGSVAWVRALAAAGVRGIGLCGVDGGLLRATRRPGAWGAVGDLQTVQIDVLAPLLAAGFVPVISPLAISVSGEVLNVNADTVAAAIAVALGAERLVLWTSVGGIRRVPSDPGSVLKATDLAELADLEDHGVLTGGMRPKLAAIRAALAGGVGVVEVGDTVVAGRPTL